MDARFFLCSNEWRCIAHAHPPLLNRLLAQVDWTPLCAKGWPFSAQLTCALSQAYGAPVSPVQLSASGDLDLFKRKLKQEVKQDRQKQLL